MTAYPETFENSDKEKDVAYTPEMYQYLNKSDMLNSQDVFDYQSHTFDLHQRKENGVSLLVHQPKRAIQPDLEQSIQHLNGKEYAFAYPFGEYTKSTVELLKDLPFNMAFTTESGKASPKEIVDLYQIPRIEISSEYSLTDFKNIWNDDERCKGQDE